MMRFFRDRRGTMTILTSILLIPVAMSVGLSIDLARQIKVREQLQSIADAGAITAVTDETNVKTEADLEAAAKSLLKANGGLKIREIGLDFDVKVSIDRTTSKRVATVTYRGAVPTTFMALAGVHAVTVSGKATASSGLPPDTDFYFLLDTSDSMGLAATDAARTTLIAKSQANGSGTCEFACHVKRGGTKTLLEVARANNVKLRIDVAKEGVTNVVTMADAAARRDHVVNRYAVTTFSSKVATVSELTASADVLKTKLAGIDLGHGMGTALANTLWETTTPTYVTELKRLTTVGANPVSDRIVVLVTDGLRSQDGGSGTDSKGRKLIRPFDLDQCKAIKDAGYKLAVVYTMYYDIPYNAWYNTHVKPIRPQLQTNLEACATPGLFAVGDTPDEIQKAFEKIFKATRAVPHITS